MCGEVVRLVWVVWDVCGMCVSEGRVSYRQRQYSHLQTSSNKDKREGRKWRRESAKQNHQAPPWRECKTKVLASELHTWTFYTLSSLTSKNNANEHYKHNKPHSFFKFKNRHLSRNKKLNPKHVIDPHYYISAPRSGN